MSTSFNKERKSVKGCFYHVCTKSIAGYTVFRSDSDYTRMLDMMGFYSYQSKIPAKFSYYYRLSEDNKINFMNNLSNSGKLVDILSYCIMPTHLHFLFISLEDNAVSLYMKNLLNSYTRYFNTKYSRKGPLWQGRFRSVLVESHEQLLHLTRYIHLNPVSAGIINNLGDWPYSSYKEYIGNKPKFISRIEDYIDLTPKNYRNFVEEHKDYQRDLAIIKHLLLE